MPGLASGLASRDSGGMGIRAPWVFMAALGCGRVNFDRVDQGGVVVDGQVSDGTALNDGTDNDGPVSCSGALAATCPVMVRAISTGMNVHVSGSTSGLADGRAGSCGGTGSAELILQLDIAQFGFFDISTAGSDFDTVVYVFDGDCSTSEFDCRNAVTGPGGETFTIGVAHAGPFMIVVDGIGGGCGHVELDIQG